MNKLQHYIRALEAAAAECELISRRALATDVRAHNAGLATKFLGVANELQHPERIATKDPLADNRLLVARQRGIVARLQSQGHSTDQARRLLDVLEDTLALLEQRRRPIGIREIRRANGPSLTDLLHVLVCTATEHADGNARAAFYLSDASEQTLHHVTGMSREYALKVDGFAIGEHSLACGLAVATRRPILTPDVTEEPRWKEWVWLARRFDYRACWSFPIATSSKVFGSFAMYYAEPHAASPRDLDLASTITRAAASIISLYQ